MNRATPSSDPPGWFSRLRAGLSQTSERIADAITGSFRSSDVKQRRQQIEETLLRTDVGLELSVTLAALAANQKTPPEAQRVVAQAIAEILAPCERPIPQPATPEELEVILVAGVNGGGKTTTCGKLAHQWKQNGYQVAMISGDAFRAAAVEQLATWARRTQCPLLPIASPTQSSKDVASVVFEGLKQAREKGMNIALVDTAGRLPTNQNLRDELSKIQRICIRQANHPERCRSILILDGTVGQNAHRQVEMFSQTLDLDGLVLTKLDGTTKAGVIVSLAKRFELPIFAIGVGENLDDLQPFNARAFAQALLDVPAPVTS